MIRSGEMDGLNFIKRLTYCILNKTYLQKNEELTEQYLYFLLSNKNQNV